MRKQFKTKNGYKTNIDRYVVIRNGQRYTTTWGKTKAFQAARSIASNLFQQNKDRIEIANEYTGEIFKIQ